MIDINWNNYKAKFNGREKNIFESLAYMLFCYEHNIKVGIFRFKNQTGIETEPINFDGLKLGFQAKYYDTRLSENKTDIIDSIKKAKSKNSDLNKILVYTNQELSESSNKGQKKPKYLADIEEIAKQVGVEIDWRLPSHIEKQLSVKENDYLSQYFFGSDNGIIEFLNNLKNHTQNILFAIQTDILFKGQQIKIERPGTLTRLNKNSSQIIILSGNGGSGKTALIKDFFKDNAQPRYVFKAAEFYKSSLSAIFYQFGAYGIEDFLLSHKEEADKIFVIDSAEKLADLENQDVFIEFLSTLIKNQWKVIFTTRNNYLDDLCFQMIEVYRLPFDIIRLDNLNHGELKKMSDTFQFRLPDDVRLQNLICNLFYLNEYLSNYDTIIDKTNSDKFRAILWQKKIQNSRFKKDNTHLKREKCFLSLAKSRCELGNFFLKGDQCDNRILALLETDEIIKYEPSQNGYFITHDIYEEWALEKIIEDEFNALSSYPSFFKNIGNSLPIRRSFRSWLSDKLQQANPSIKQFIEDVFNEKAIPDFWKDELLISVLLSDYSLSFFKIFDSVLLTNKKFYLRKIIFLLRTACKEVDITIQRLLQAKKDLSVSPAYVFTKPKGKGWEATIEYLFSKIDTITKEELAFILPMLKEWTGKQAYGETTRLAGLFALRFYKDSELNSSVYYGSDSEELLLKIVLSAARELGKELIQITDELLNDGYDRQKPFDSLREKVLTSNHESLAYIATLPEYVIKLANASWFQPQTDRHPFYSSGIDVEQYYSIRGHHEYFPASALQTPIFYLLIVAFPQTIDFILDFTNRTIGAYFSSGFDSSVHEIEITIDTVKIKQYISSGLWNIYRGSGSPVTPYLLQSMHMALEKHLLKMAKSSDKEILKTWLMYLLKNTHSASITAVVTSIVLAYPDELFEIAAILFSNYDFFKYDNQRALSENEAKSLYSIGRGMNWKSKEFEDERIATCDDAHRKLSLENLALQYQFFRNQNVPEEEADKRVATIWSIIDNIYKSVPDEIIETDRGKAIRLLLTRIDKRKMNPIVSQIEKNKLQIEFNPTLDPDLKEYSEEGMQEYHSKFKYTSLNLWAMNKFDARNQYGPYPQYEENPELVLKETREIIEGWQKQDEEFDLFNRQVPAYTCASLIKHYKNKLSPDDINFCSQIIIDYATAPLRENYNYQIADGVEVAISTLPFLYKVFPENRYDYNIILLLILFDAYPIGQYKRICDYAIEAINNSVFEFSPDDANAILLRYLHFKPKFDSIYNPVKNMRHRTSRIEALNEFITQYEKELEKIEPTEEYYAKIDFDILGILTAETGFQIIPADSLNPIHLDYIKKLLTTYSGQLLAETRYSDNSTEADYRLKHRFFRKYAKFLLYREIATIKAWTEPFVNAFTVSREMADFLSDVVSEEDRMCKYDSFWEIWHCLYPVIKSAVERSNGRDLDEIIRNYMLAWPYWKETATEWRSLKEENMIFFKRICSEMGSHPTVLFSIAKLLNEIGSPFLDDGIVWISDMISKNKNLHNSDLQPNTIYYLEILIRKYVYLNRTKLKSNRILKDKVLVLLNFLIAKGSVNGYLLREDIF